VSRRRRILSLLIATFLGIALATIAVTVANGQIVINNGSANIWLRVIPMTDAGSIIEGTADPQGRLLVNVAAMSTDGGMISIPVPLPVIVYNDAGQAVPVVVYNDAGMPFYVLDPSGASLALNSTALSQLAQLQTIASLVDASIVISSEQLTQLESINLNTQDIASLSDASVVIGEEQLTQLETLVSIADGGIVLSEQQLSELTSIFNVSFDILGYQEVISVNQLPPGIGPQPPDQSFSVVNAQSTRTDLGLPQDAGSSALLMIGPGVFYGASMMFQIPDGGVTVCLFDGNPLGDAGFNGLQVAQIQTQGPVNISSPSSIGTPFSRGLYVSFGAGGTQCAGVSSFPNGFFNVTTQAPYASLAVVLDGGL
jgi:hypothetical protein